MRTFPDPDALYPIPGIRNTVLLRPLLAGRPDIANIEAGAYSYYSDIEDPTRFPDRNVLYNFGLSGARLVVGRYCALAHGASFMMPDANHALGGPSTFPFPIFGHAWAESLGVGDLPVPDKGDTVVGNDVWIGHEALVMPGLRIGNGAVIAARAVVAADVPDYAVVAGNPARIVRRRFAEAVVRRLLALAWWDWPVETVTAAVPLLVKGDVDRLEEFASRAR